MIAVTANLESLLAAGIEAGKLIVQLHGYGQQVPRVGGLAMLARTAQAVAPDASTGVATFTLYGNDVITPAGTYYTVKVEDSNGTLIQVNAYLFTGAGPFDLSTVAPFDPSSMIVPPLPPPPASLLVSVPFAPALAFDGLAGLAYAVTLTGNVSSCTLPNAVPGNLYTFLITQDATGGRQWMYPTQMRGGGQIDPTPNATTIQTAVALASGNLDAAAPAMYAGVGA